MPNKKSAAKAVRQTAKRREHNRMGRSAFRTALKKAEKALADGNAEQASAQVRDAFQVIGKTAKKGLIHENKAARHFSHLSQRLNALLNKSQGSPKSDAQS